MKNQITTKTLPATATLPTRIIAFDGNGHSLTISAHPAGLGSQQAHQYAETLLAEKVSKYGLTFTDEKISETEFTLTRKHVQKWGNEDLITVGCFRVSFIDTDPTDRLDVGDGWSRLGWGEAQIYKTRGIAAGVVRRSFKSGSWNHTFDADLFIYPHRSGYSIANTSD